MKFYGIPKYNSKIDKNKIDLKLWHKEFIDILIPPTYGQCKYGRTNYMEPNGSTMSHKDNFASIFRHTAKACAGIKLDKESGIDNRLMAAWRLMASYMRDKKGIIHINDK